MDETSGQGLARDRVNERLEAGTKPDTSTWGRGRQRGKAAADRSVGRIVSEGRKTP